ncbi:MAG: thioredoxin domain-containing protein [Oscillospiraceae bacterium]|nr:thioredoxin domain-containing protein [Oscillospiraceae bacterium]
MPNLLQFERSPYLLQHADNPVDWHPWNDEALSMARREHKPIFLSIGYSTCHWCHVMARESFTSPEVAAVLNRFFVPIKVDREERPDIDSVYMAACMAMNGSGGWPLTVLLTPDEKPFWAGTYLPKEHLLFLLEQVAQRWQAQPEALADAAKALTDHLRQQQSVRPGTPTPALVRSGVVQFAEQFDETWGGFGPAPKFPSAHNLLFILQYHQRTGDPASLRMVETTLERMYRGGMFDHIGGGFSRYSTDRQWLVPHFEKMLYDNALLSLAYTEAYRQTLKPYYAKVVRRTLDYVLRELTDPDGGFYCGQDADSDGVEGKYYVFTPEEVARILGEEDGQRFCRRYGITARGNFAQKSIPNLIDASDWAEEDPTLEPLREALYDARKQRTRLHRDDKVLTAWNGLMIAAFAQAGLVLEESRYVDAAKNAVRFLQTNVMENGRLLARWYHGDAAHPGKLEDYAFFALGLLTLYGATLQAEVLEAACGLSSQLLDRFFDWEQGGFYPYADDGEQLITRTKEVYDGAMPSGNSAAALVLSRLSRLTGEPRWRKAADLQLRYLAGAVQSYPAGHSMTLLTFLEELWPSSELICTATSCPEDLLAFLREEPHPGLTTLLKTKDNSPILSSLAPFTDSYPIPEKGAQYFYCQGKTCAQPVQSIPALRSLMASLSAEK